MKVRVTKEYYDRDNQDKMQVGAELIVKEGRGKILMDRHLVEEVHEEVKNIKNSATEQRKDIEPPILKGKNKSLK